MNATPLVTDLAEVARFVAAWDALTGVGHITLTAIHPDSDKPKANRPSTATCTFAVGDVDDATGWVARAQRAGFNVYFQPNETQPDCSVKPTKAAMQAAICRYADVDPVDGVPLAGERERLHKLAEHLADDPDWAPAFIIDSGNGVQAIWICNRQVLSPKIIEGVESETKAIEAALGAGGTHNIDRLLRLPGTLNFPNEVKRGKGRGISQARVIHFGAAVYQPDQMPALAAHLAATLPATGLVRARPAASAKRGEGGNDTADKAAVLALMAELKAAGADHISAVEHLPEGLRERLETALQRAQEKAARKRANDPAAAARCSLSERWAGMVDDLKDDSNSGLELSLAAMLKWAGFGLVETGLLLCANPYTKTNQDEWTGDYRLRNAARCAIRSNGPKRAQSLDEMIWPSPLDFIAAQEIEPPELKEEHIPAALWPYVFDTSQLMGVDRTGPAMFAITVCSSVITDDWFLQLRAFDTSYRVQARIWAALVGDPGALKSPILTAFCRVLDILEAEARDTYQLAMCTYAVDHRIWKKAVKKDPEVVEPRRPKRVRYVIESATMEALQEVLRDDDGATQYAPAHKVLSRQAEMSEFFSNLDRYTVGGKGGGDRGSYLRLHDGGPYSLDRIGRGHFRIENWSACLLGCIQPEPLQRLASEGDDDGLFARFIYAVPGPPRAGVDRVPDEAAAERYRNLVKALAILRPVRNAVGKLQHVVLHKDGHPIRERIEALARSMACVPDVTPRFKSALAKWSGLFGRLALVFHMINCADAQVLTGPELQVVPVQTLEQVALFMEEIVLPHLLRADAVMNRTAQTTHARWIAGYVLARGPAATRITARDIQRSYKQLQAPEMRKELSDVMASLVQIGWLEPEEPSNGLKPVASWLINPAVFTQFPDRAVAAAKEREEASKAMAVAFELLKKLRGGGGK